MVGIDLDQPATSGNVMLSRERLLKRSLGLGPDTGLSVNDFLHQSVADSMTREVKTVTCGMTLHQLGGLFSSGDLDAYPVEEHSRVVGIVTKFDYLAAFVGAPGSPPSYEKLQRRTVADVMVPDFIYVGSETKLTRVLQLMVDYRIISMPVLEADRRLIGIISRHDVIAALDHRMNLSAATQG